MKVSKGVKKGVEPGVEDLAVDRYRCRVSLEVQKHQTQEIRLDQSTKCRDCDKKKLGSSTDSQVSRRCQASF